MPSRNAPGVFGLFILLGLAQFSPGEIPGLTTSDLGAPPPDDLKNGAFVVSPDGVHVAYFQGGSTRTPTALFGNDNAPARIVVDGQPSPPFKAVFRPVFSDNGAHVAYFAATESLVIVIDGRTRDDGVDYVSGDPVFSADGEHVAYVGLDRNANDNPSAKGPDQEAQNKRRFVVRDGQRGRVYPGIGPLIFSADGRRLAYAARTDDDLWRVVCDDTEGDTYHGIGKDSIVFSPDGKRLVYTARLSDQRWSIVMDGKMSPPSQSIGRPSFSPDGSLLAFDVFKDEDHGVMIVNGKRHGDVYDAIDLPIFSSDGRHVLFTARRDKQWRIVRDGAEEPAYRDVRSPLLGADGSHFACVVSQTQRQERILHDGKPLPGTFEAVSQLCGSADGSRVAGVGRTADKCQIIDSLSTQARPATFDEIRHLAISADGTHLAYWARQDSKWALVIDGDRDDRFDQPLPGTRLAFTPAGDLKTLAVSGRSIYRISVKYSRTRM